MSPQFRIPALDAVSCPKCQSGNTDKKTYVWETVDERGKHFQCDVCAHAFPFVVAALNAPCRSSG